MTFVRHLISVPQLPWEIQDQDNGVHILEYVAAEETTLHAGGTLVRLETWWAVLELRSRVKCWVSKNLYDRPMFRRSLVKVGELLSVAYSDVDDLVGVDEPYFDLVVTSNLRQKPQKRK